MDKHTIEVLIEISMTELKARRKKWLEMTAPDTEEEDWEVEEAGTDCYVVEQTIQFLAQQLKLLK